MASGHEHYTKAERCLAQATERGISAHNADRYRAAAQIHATLALAAAHGADREPECAVPQRRPDTTLLEHLLEAFEPDEDHVELPALAERLGIRHPNLYEDASAQILAENLHHAPWRISARRIYTGRENGAFVYRRAIARADLERAVDRTGRPTR